MPQPAWGHCWAPDTVEGSRLGFFLLSELLTQQSAKPAWQLKRELTLSLENVANHSVSDLPTRCARIANALNSEELKTVFNGLSHHWESDCGAALGPLGAAAQGLHRRTVTRAVNPAVSEVEISESTAKTSVT